MKGRVTQEMGSETYVGQYQPSIVGGCAKRSDTPRSDTPMESNLSLLVEKASRYHELVIRLDSVLCVPKPAKNEACEASIPALTINDKLMVIVDDFRRSNNNLETLIEGVEEHLGVWKILG